MISSTPERKRLLWRAAFALLLACVAVYLARRNFGLHPVIFADEWYYSKMARLQPLAEAIVPSYLYLWLFGASSGCGAGFLDCVRGGNIAFHIGAAPFLYLTARRFTGRGWAGAIALLSTLAPLNLYTMFFMPEATYYFGFCVLSWVLLAHPERPQPAVAALGGAVLGAMSLVKVHALFLIPSLCLYLLYAAWHAGGRWLLRGLGAALLGAALTVGVKFALGFALAGDAGLSLLGPFYGASAGGGVPLPERLAATLMSARGHLMALAVLLGLPLAVLLHALFSDVLRRRGAPANPLLVYVLLMLGAAAGMTVVYAGTIAHVGNNEGLRLHMRYYSFTFPLLWLVAAAAMGRVDAGHGAARLPVPGTGLPWLRPLVAVLVAATLVWAYLRLPTFVIYLVDGPDIASVNPGLKSAKAIFALQLVLLLLWALRRWNAPRLFLLTVLPLSLLVAQQGIVEFQAQYRPTTVGDRAGLLARQVVPAAERGQLTVVCVDPQQLMRAQFHIDHPASRPMYMDGHFPIEEYQLPLDQKWMLVIGQHPLPPGVRIVHRSPDFVLARLPDPAPVVARVPLSMPHDPALVRAIGGLSGIEPWGRWSDGERVTVEFAHPLPRHMGVMLRARAFGVNTTLPFRLEIGEGGKRTAKEFRLGGGTQSIGLHADTDGTARTLTIVVPRPQSPAELGQGGDTRRLGIALEEVVITGAAPMR